MSGENITTSSICLVAKSNEFISSLQWKNQSQGFYAWNQKDGKQFENECLDKDLGSRQI